MSFDTPQIITLATQIPHSLYPGFTPPPVEYSAQVNCDDLNEVELLRINTRGVKTGYDLINSLIHSLTHVIHTRTAPERKTHYSNGRHSSTFAEIELRLTRAAEALPDWDAHLFGIGHHVDTVLAKRPRHTATAYERVTLACPHEICRHTLTIRTSAAEKTQLICREHQLEMEPR